MASSPVTVPALQQMKREGKKSVGVVAWDYQVAQIADRAGVDMVVVGDSVGVNLWGHANPLEVTMEEMLVCCKAVRRGTKRALVSCDIPFGPLQEGVDSALRAAIRLVKEGGADMIKLDAAAEFPEAVTAITRAGIPVFAQFGLTPQTALKYGVPYGAQNSAGAQATAETTVRLVAEAKRLEAAGAVALDFTNSGPAAGPAVVAAVSIPVIGGFGGGPWLDGRVRLAQTALGSSAKWLDSQADTYVNTAKLALDAFTALIGDVPADQGLREPRPRRNGSDRTMPTAIIDGISTRYEVQGDGPPLLMYAPGGFDATIEKWSTQGVYAKVKFLDHLPRHYTCITFDRRECGQSAGRVERVTWAHYVAQGRGLLDHLKIERAHLMGGCMGVCPVAAFGVAHPERVLSLVLFWPVGGAKYRISSHQRFAEHLAFVQQNGLQAVAGLVAKDGKSFGADPRGGPWASVLKHDRAFAEAYVRQDVERYKLTVVGMGRTLVDRDTAPGAEPEDLLRCDLPALVVPGSDAAHATSAARYLQECLPRADYWDVPASEQIEANTPARVLEFLDKAGR
jgi:3-methyl-2-oxobutanoate hydroxymethyltransferase